MCTCVILSLHNRLRLYPEEGPVPKALVAPFTLVDIFAVQFRERPPGRRRSRPLGATRKKTKMISIRRRGRRRSRRAVAEDASQKPDCPHTRAGVSMQGVVFRRPALSISVRAEVRDGDEQRATRREERGLIVSRRDGR